MTKRPSILLGGGHLAALWALAVVQPLLGLLGSNPEFFVARENSSIEIIGFALLVTFLPPLIATGIEALLELLSRKVRWGFHLVLIGLLFAALILQFLKQIADGPAALMIVVAIAAGALLAWAYAHRQFVRSLTDILIAAPVVIVIAFLFFSESAELTTSTDDVEAHEVSIENPAPVVMLVFDEFPVGSLMTPDGGINRKRFPAFAELAGTSAWFRNTTTRAAYTTIAVPSLLTGLTPDPDSLPTAADHPDSLYTFLGDDYRINSVEPITQVCPESLCPENAEEDGGFLDAMSAFTADLKVVSAHLLLPESLGESLPDISQTFEGFGGNGGEGLSADRAQAERWVVSRHEEGGRAFDGNSTIEEMLAGLDGKQPSFNFAHASDPHYPWIQYPSGVTYANGTDDFRFFDVDEIWSGNEYVTDRATQAHLLDVGNVDRLVGRVVERLKSEGMWEDSLFIVTADHGSALLPGISRRDAGPENVGDVAMVPLFMKQPGQNEGRVVDRHTCSNEIPAMIARTLRTDLPWETAACDPSKVIVDNGSGPPFTAPVELAIRQRQEYVERIAALFGADTGWDRVMELGPNQDLIGRGTGRIPKLEGEGTSIDPDQSGNAVDYYRPRAANNKVLRQRGTIEGLKKPAPLAISVGGRIAAVGWSFLEGDLMRYTILLPESSLRAGRNEIELFAVRRGPGGASLARLGAPSDQ